jgi:serine/threonine protein kinase
LDINAKKVSELITELRTLHTSNHPNIVAFHGAFFEERAVSLVLEYMNGGSLLDIMKTLKV